MTGYLHFRVIDNASDFKDKMRRLISEISSLVLLGERRSGKPVESDVIFPQFLEGDGHESIDITAAVKRKALFRYIVIRVSILAVMDVSINQPAAFAVARQSGIG